MAAETIAALEKRFLVGKELWRDTNGEPYITLNDGRNIKISSREMSQVIHIFKKDGSNTTRMTLKDLLEAEAMENGKTYQTYVRVSDRYLDLGNSYIDLTTLQPTTKVTDQKFIRPSTLGTLPEPIYENGLDTLTSLMPNISPDDYPLIHGLAVSAMRPNSPHFILALGGSAGSAKTTTQRILTLCIDPRKGDFDAQSTPFSSRDPRDLDAVAMSQHTISLDNLSTLAPSISDRIATYSTGGAIASRALYTNGDLYTRSISKPVFLNGIGEIVTRPDLLSRAIIVQCQLKDHKNLQAVEAEFYKLRPFILGSILKHVQRAITGQHYEAKIDSRMASAIEWIESSGIRFEPRYQRWLNDADYQAIEMSPVGSYILDLIDRWNRGIMTEKIKEVQRERHASIDLHVPTSCYITTWSDVYNSHKGESDWPRTEIGFSSARKMIQRNLINIGYDWCEHSTASHMIRYVIIGPDADIASIESKQ